MPQKLARHPIATTQNASQHNQQRVLDSKRDSNRRCNARARRFAARIRFLLTCAAAVGLLFSTATAFAQLEPRPKKRGRKYRVRIDSAPQRAAVYLDDKKYGIVGYTPWEGRLQKGNWLVIIEADGYKETQKTIRVRRTRRLQETFIPLVKQYQPAVLDIRADADPNSFGAEVWMDGQLQGQIPILVKANDGRHLIEIKKDGYQAFAQWVEVKEGERVNLNPVLKANQKINRGDVLVEADAAGAEVYIDGKKHTDLTPTLIRGLVAGPHVLEVRKDGLSWKQSINITAGKTAKVSAALKATGSAVVRILANVAGARVIFDGTDLGEAPLDVRDVRPGEHVIEVRKPGFKTSEQRPNIVAGSDIVLKFDLQAAGKTGDATIQVVSPEPEADVFVDGKRLGPAPQEVSVSAGEHFVVVQKQGFAKFERKIAIKAGQSLTVTAELAAVGRVRFLSTPSGAQVMVDGIAVGKTPLVREDIETGGHAVTIRYPKHDVFETNITVIGGELQVVNARLRGGKTVREKRTEQRGLSSWGARVLPRGRSTVDLSTGYPYYFEGRFSVGAGNIGNFGVDASVLLRTFFSRTDLGLTGRVTLLEANPFSLGAFTSLGGGSTFFDESSRSTIFWDLGVMASLSGLGNITVTGRAYLNMWSDRHCPGLRGAEGSEQITGSPISTCEEFLERKNGGNPGGLSAADVSEIESLVDGSPFDRDFGMRAMVSLMVEVAYSQRWNVWVLFEGAPFQGERAAFTNYFSALMFDTDFGTYGRIGATYKF